MKGTKLSDIACCNYMKITVANLHLYMLYYLSRLQHSLETQHRKTLVHVDFSDDLTSDVT